MRRLVLLPLLAACAPADLPPPPELVPLGSLLAAGDALGAQASPGPGLSAEAAELAGRAGAIAAPGGHGGGADAARLAALAARAEALRAPVLSEAERARLGPGPAGAPSLQ